MYIVLVYIGVFIVIWSILFVILKLCADIDRQWRISYPVINFNIFMNAYTLASEQWELDERTVTFWDMRYGTFRTTFKFNYLDYRKYKKWRETCKTEEWNNKQYQVLDQIIQKYKENNNASAYKG